MHKKPVWYMQEIQCMCITEVDDGINSSCGTVILFDMYDAWLWCLQHDFNASVSLISGNKAFILKTKHNHFLGTEPGEGGVWAAAGAVLHGAGGGGQRQLRHLQGLQAHLGGQAEGPCDGAQPGLLPGDPAGLRGPHGDCPPGTRLPFKCTPGPSL